MYRLECAVITKHSLADLLDVHNVLGLVQADTELAYPGKVDTGFRLGVRIEAAQAVEQASVVIYILIGVPFARLVVSSVSPVGPSVLGHASRTVYRSLVVIVLRHGTSQILIVLDQKVWRHVISRAFKGCEKLRYAVQVAAVHASEQDYVGREQGHDVRIVFRVVLNRPVIVHLVTQHRLFLHNQTPVNREECPSLVMALETIAVFLVVVKRYCLYTEPVVLRGVPYTFGSGQRLKGAHRVCCIGIVDSHLLRARPVYLDMLVRPPGVDLSSVTPLVFGVPCKQAEEYFLFRPYFSIP